MGKKGWVVKKERPEDKGEATEEYDKEGAEHYEREGMKRIQKTIMIRALLLAKIPQGAKVLDAGCGTGFGMELLAEAGYEAQGFDVSQAMVEKAKAKGFEVKQGDLRSIPFDDHSFDAIVSISALQWVPLQEREKVAKEFWRVLKEKATAVIQHYPKSEDEMMRTGLLFRRQGFKVTLQIDNEDNPRKRKIYMLLDK